MENPILLYAIHEERKSQMVETAVSYSPKRKCKHKTKIQKQTGKLYVYRQCVGAKRLMHQRDIFQYTEVKHVELYVNNSNCSAARAKDRSQAD